MPQVPIYGGGAPTVQTRALPGGQLRPVQNNSGEIIAQAGEQLGGAVAQAGQVVDHLNAIKDEAFVKSLDAAYGQQETALLYGPNGYVNMRGSHAVDGAASTQQQLDQLRNETLARAQTPRQRQMLTAAMYGRADTSTKIVASHAAKEAIAYQDQASSERRDGLLQQGLGAFGTQTTTVDGRTVDAGEQYMHAAVQEQMDLDERKGVSGDERANNVRSITSGFYGSLIQRAVVAEDASAANSLMEKHGGELTDSDRLKLNSQLHELNLDEDAYAAVNDYTTQGARASGPTADAAGSDSIPAGSAPPPPPREHVVSVVRDEWKKAGLDANDGITFMAIESGGRDVSNGSSTSYFQFQPKTWASLGGGDIHDLRTQAHHAALYYKQNRQALIRAGVANPTPWQVYLSHQQGPGGAKALLRAAPTANAVDVLKAAGVDNALGHIKGNVPKSLRGQAANLTVAQFTGYWQNTYQKAANRGGAALAQDAGVRQSVAADGPPSMTMADIHAFAVSRAGGNHKLEQRIEQGIRTNQAQVEADRGHQARELERSAQPYLQQHVSWDGLPGNLKADITATDPEFKTRWMAEDEARAKAASAQQRSEGNIPLFAAMSEAYSKSPIDFQKQFPRAKIIGAGLSTGQLDKALAWHDATDQALKNGSPNGRDPLHWTISNVRQFAKTRLAAAGMPDAPITTEQKMGKVAYRAAVENERRIQDFTDWVMRDVNYVQNSTRKVVDEQALNRIMDGALVHGRWKQDEGGKLKEHQGYAFEVARARANGQPIAYGNLTWDMPKADEQNLRLWFMAKNGRQPTPTELGKVWYDHQLYKVPIRPFVPTTKPKS